MTVSVVRLDAHASRRTMVVMPGASDETRTPRGSQTSTASPAPMGTPVASRSWCDRGRPAAAPRRDDPTIHLVQRTVRARLGRDRGSGMSTTPRRSVTSGSRRGWRSSDRRLRPRPTRRLAGRRRPEPDRIRLAGCPDRARLGRSGRTLRRSGCGLVGYSGPRSAPRRIWRRIARARRMARDSDRHVSSSSSGCFPA